MNEQDAPNPDGPAELTDEEARLRRVLALMLEDADEHVQDVARRCPGMLMRRSGATPLEGEWEVYLVDRDNNDEIVVVGTFSSLQVRRPQQG
jgi:hypothetical protein